MNDIEIFYLLKNILLYFSDAESALEWLKTSHPALGTSPLIAIANGKKDQVIYLLTYNNELEA